MGYIKKLKNNELVGGTDKQTIYPVTSAEAVFEEVIEDGLSNFKSQKFLNNNITGNRINEGTITDYNIAEGTITKEKLTHQVQTMLDEGQKKALTPKGNYNPETEYEALDLVFDPATNSSYVSLVTPNTYPVDENAEGYEEGKWDKVLDGTAVNTALAAINTKIGELDTLVTDAITQAEGHVDTKLDYLDGQVTDAIGQANQDIQDLIDASEQALVDATKAANDAADAVESLTAGKIPDALIGFYVCNSLATADTKSTTSDTIGETQYFLPASGSLVKIRMVNANTVTNTVYLQFGDNLTTKRPLYYNGAAVSASNTWEAGEVISVYFDNTIGTNGVYQASNAMGGGSAIGKRKLTGSQGYVSLSGTTAPNPTTSGGSTAQYRYIQYSVNEGDVVEIKGKGNGSAWTWALIDSTDNRKIVESSNGIADYTTVPFVKIIPSGVDMIIINNYITGYANYEWYYAKAGSVGAHEILTESYLYGDLKNLSTGQVYKIDEAVKTTSGLLLKICKEINVMNVTDTVKVDDLKAVTSGQNIGTYLALKEINKYNLNTVYNDGDYVIGSPTKASFTISRVQNGGTININFNETSINITSEQEDSVEFIATSITNALNNVRVISEDTGEEEDLGWTFTCNDNIITATCNRNGNNSETLFSIIGTSGTGITSNLSIILNGKDNSSDEVEDRTPTILLMTLNLGTGIINVTIGDTTNSISITNLDAPSDIATLITNNLWNDCNVSIDEEDNTKVIVMSSDVIDIPSIDDNVFGVNCDGQIEQEGTDVLNKYDEANSTFNLVTLDEYSSDSVNIDDVYNNEMWKKVNTYWLESTNNLIVKQNAVPKLYDDVGTNVDGAMTLAAISDPVEIRKLIKNITVPRGGSGSYTLDFAAFAGGSYIMEIDTPVEDNVVATIRLRDGTKNPQNFTNIPLDGGTYTYYFTRNYRTSRIYQFFYRPGSTTEISGSHGPFVVRIYIKMSDYSRLYSIPYDLSAYTNLTQYSLETAVQAIPPEKRQIGMLLKFIGNDGKYYIYLYKDSTLNNIQNPSYWQLLECSQNDIPYDISFYNNNTAYTISQAIKNVPIYLRRPGMLIRFININKEYSLYKFKDISISNFENKDYWLPVACSKDEINGIFRINMRKLSFGKYKIIANESASNFGAQVAVNSIVWGSTYILCEGYKYLYIDLYPHASEYLQGCVFYDADKLPIHGYGSLSMLGASSNYSSSTGYFYRYPKQLEIPSNAVYFRTTFRNKIYPNAVLISDNSTQIHQTPGWTLNTYTGEKIELSSTHNMYLGRYMYLSIGNMPNLSHQGACVWGDYFFAFDKNNYFSVLDMKQSAGAKTNPILAAIRIPNMATSNIHNDSVFFTNRYYANGDEFPLLLCGGGSGNDSGVTYFYALRIVKEDNEGTITFTPTVVQTITVIGNPGAWMTPYYDSDRGVICSSHGGKTIITNKTVSGTDGDFTLDLTNPSNIIQEFPYYVHSSGAYCNGKLFGVYDNNGLPLFLVLDIYTGRYTSFRIPRWSEPEGVVLWNGELYVYYVSWLGKVYFE